jgi:anti-sigma factor RsiW
MTIKEMTCERVDEALSDYVEEELNENDRAAVERHLQECVRCAGVVRDLDRIRTEAAALPDLAPSRDLWAGIEARIAAPVIPLATREQNAKRFAPWMAAAAAALIVSTAGITYVVTSSSMKNAQPSRVAVAPAAAPVSSARESSNTTAQENDSAISAEPTSETNHAAAVLEASSQGNSTSARAATRGGAQMVSREPDVRSLNADEVYGKEIRMLQRIVSDRRTQLDSSTVAIIERNLTIIDAAIAQSKAALAKDPASQLLSDQLTRALDKKVELLRTAAMLPAST